MDIKIYDELGNELNISESHIDDEGLIIVVN